MLVDNYRTALHALLKEVGLNMLKSICISAAAGCFVLNEDKEQRHHEAEAQQVSVVVFQRTARKPS